MISGDFAGVLRGGRPVRGVADRRARVVVRDRRHSGGTGQRGSGDAGGGGPGAAGRIGGTPPARLPLPGPGAPHHEHQLPLRLRKEPSLHPLRRATPRRYLMCPPVHFDVTYAINPWMDPAKPVDVPLALAQWEDLRDRYRSLGHTVEELAPRPGLPDMVFAANGATVLDGRVLGARFAFRERAPEAAAHLEWFRARGFAEVLEPVHVNEGEGDFAVTASYVLAGRGFRASPLSHGEAQEFFGRPVIG